MSRTPLLSHHPRCTSKHLPAVVEAHGASRTERAGSDLATVNDVSAPQEVLAIWTAIIVARLNQELVSAHYYVILWLCDYGPYHIIDMYTVLRGIGRGMSESDEPVSIESSRSGTEQSLALVIIYIGGARAAGGAGVLCDRFLRHGTSRARS